MPEARYPPLFLPWSILFSSLFHLISKQPSPFSKHDEKERGGGREKEGERAPLRPTVFSSPRGVNWDIKDDVGARQRYLVIEKLFIFLPVFSFYSRSLLILPLIRCSLITFVPTKEIVSCYSTLQRFSVG